MRRYRLGKALIYPPTPLQRSFDRAFTGLKTVLSQVVDQQMGAPARFEVGIIAGRFGQHRLQERQSGVLLAVGASNRQGLLEPLEPLVQVGFEPTADGVFMTTHGLGNSGYSLTSIREQDR